MGGLTQFTLPTRAEFNPPVLGYVPTPAMIQQLIEYEGIKVLTEEEAEETGSYFGFPIFGVVELVAPTPERGQPGFRNLLIESCVIEVNVSKNFTKTPITNRKGSVKQSIGLDDYNVTINGGLFSPKGDLRKPWESIKLLNEFMRHRGMIKVNNKLLTELGIYDLLLSNMRMIPSEFVNVQRFELTCLSDSEYTVKTKRRA